MTEPLHRTVGFIGVDGVGTAMADRVAAAGYPLYAVVRSRRQGDGLVARHIRLRDIPREVAESAFIVMMFLPDDAALQAVADGPKNSSPASMRARQAGSWPLTPPGAAAVRPHRLRGPDPAPETSPGCCRQRRPWPTSGRRPWDRGAPSRRAPRGGA